jgi:serine/threonine-protein kinase
MTALEPRLPAALRGDEKTGDAAEGLTFAEMADRSRRFSASARLYTEALRTDPKRVEDLKSGHRYNAACAAAPAGAGWGEERPPPAEDERVRWREQAVASLEAEPASLRRQVETGQPEAGAAAARMLRHRKQDSDRAGIRDPEDLANLPAEEQQACRKLWADVDALQARAARPRFDRTAGLRVVAPLRTP